jgi:hypothetical protein
MAGGLRILLQDVSSLTISQATAPSSLQPIATLTPYKPHVIANSEPAILHISNTVSSEDQILVLLALIYSEVKRQ